MYREINHQHKSPFTYERTLNGVNVPYEDKGWLNSGAKICTHPKEEVENSLFRWRGTDVIYICHQCKAFWHVDMSD